MELHLSDLIANHENRLYWVKRMIRSQPDKKENYMGHAEESFMWLQDMKPYCSDIETLKIKSLTDKDKTDFSKFITGNCKLIGVLEYRGERVPVYDDDYGQQYVLKFRGEEISGGAYNSCPELDFSYEMDSIMDKDILNNDSDISC